MRLTSVPLDRFLKGTDLTTHIAPIPEKLTRTLLARGVALWLLTRLMGKAVLAAGSVSATHLLPVWVVVMTSSLVLVDLHRRKELALLHNLGVTTGQAVVRAALPAVALEVLLVMLVP